MPVPLWLGNQAKACVVYNDWRYLLAKVRKSRDNTKQNANKCWLLFLGMSKNSSNFAFRQTTTFTWIATKICQKTLFFFMYNPLNIKKNDTRKKEVWVAAPAAESDVGKNVSQKELAERLDVSESMVSQWLSRKREPSLERLHEIASALGVLVSELFVLPVKQ